MECRSQNNEVFEQSVTPSIFFNFRNRLVYLTIMIMIKQKQIVVDLAPACVELEVSSGNQTWEWKIPYEWRFY